ncbi:hypothetical protein AX17_002548 [Amanita inopinata Kibby_2008]|nr:hypothetical protein AX17_002548 [Amanita inopinata Kibby_2008]
MTYAPTNPSDIPPFQLQPLISSAFEFDVEADVRVSAAQALGSEIYVGCSNGELLRFALQADDPNKLESYSLLSRQTVFTGEPIDEIVIIPSHYRALILSDSQIHFYTIPSLDPVSQNVIRPIRHVVTFAVDHLHLRRPVPPLSASQVPEPVEFCVVKWRAIALYTLRDRLYYHKEIPLPQGAILAKRIGHSLCVADSVHYNIVDLEQASLFPILPLSQAVDPTPFTIKPSITVVGDSDFLILSWTGASTLGVFITGEGDPVRGTLEWPSYPDSVCLDYPYVTSLLPNNTIEIHNVETQSIVQVIGSSPADDDRPSERTALMASVGGYLVPSTQRSEKMKMTRLPLLRGNPAE